MFRWIYKPATTWRARRPYWLQKYILACTCGVVVGMAIVAIEAAVLGLPHHSNPVPLPIGHAATISP